MVTFGYAATSGKLPLLLPRFNGHLDAFSADLALNDAMCDLIVRQGPEGRPKREPSPEGLGMLGDDPSAVGAALYRAARRINSFAFLAPT